MATTEFQRFRSSLPPRSDEDTPIGGVCAGLAGLFGLDPSVVRLAFVALGFVGVGIAIYLLLWALMPSDSAGEGAAPDPLAVRRIGGFVMLVVGAIILVRAIGFAVLPDEIVWPLIIIAAGMGLLAWQIAAGRVSSVRGAWFDQRFGVVRLVAGGLIVVFGVVAFFAANVSFRVLGAGVIAFALVAAGLALVFGPWMWLLVRDLSQERRRRVRSEEKAEVAAHLHDSVLQTLSLIQRTPDARVAAQLARRQERELRAWLYGRDVADGDLRAGVEAACAEVEDRRGVPVELVVVGEDLPIDENSQALVLALREALTNAAKFSGSDRISVFVDIGREEVEAFVRDTGVGFSPADIGDDRRGIAESITGRMERAGGEAEITSTPGEGTEVRLCVRHAVGSVR